MTNDPKSYHLQDHADFKVWVLQEPNAAKLLKEVIYRWRGSSARARGKPGKWAAYPLNNWAEWTGLSRDQVKRALRLLVLDGFILRERHRFAGTEVRPYLQPTKQALEYMGRPQDKKRLENSLAPTDAPTVAPTVAPSTAPTGAPTDYTSFPSLLHSNSPTSPQASPHSYEEGKGKAGENAGVKKKLKVKSNPKPDPEDDFDQQYAAFKAKQTENSLKHFPKLKGPHEVKVKHPSEKFPKWPNYSVQVQAKLYETYKHYVKNYNDAAKAKATGFGKSYMAIADLSDEEVEAGYQTAMAANSEWLENSGM
ncbi:hypothetical protein [Ensifer soli]|uniref:hypothetical protein n=1 Tax=Ciceribacter sp. sgz301302 TaxID=3342379 RepID=UPI0035B95E94